MRTKLVLIIGLLVVVMFCFAANNTPWDGTEWDKDSPDIDQPLGNAYKEIYSLRRGIELRMEYEHSALTVDGAASGGGVHLQGTAVAYHQDAIPTVDGDGEHFTTAASAGHLHIDTNHAIADRMFFLNTADGAGSNVWTPIATPLSGEAFTWTANHIWDDGTGASPSLTLIDGTNETAVLVKVDGANTTLTIVAADAFEIVTGNLKVGNGTPGTALNGEDMYVEGTFEVDGDVAVGGQLIAAQTITANGGLRIAIGTALTGLGSANIAWGTAGDRFTVAGTTGNTVIEGTLDVTGEVTGALNIEVIGQTPPFNGASMTTANTWQDLNLSSIVGSNSAVVYLEVKAGNSSSIYACKPKGWGGGTPGVHYNENGHDSGTAFARFSSANDYAYLTVITDTSGVISHGSSSNSDTFIVKVVGFMK